jgi:alkaline phosphatase
VNPVPRITALAALAAALAALAAALALPPIALAQATSVSVYPPTGARFLPGQRFDIRVEGKGRAPFRASLTLNGAPLRFTSGEADPVTTDGISPFDRSTGSGIGGFNVRGHSIAKPGKYTLAATFTDASGFPVTTTSTITVEAVTGESGGIRNVIIFLGDGMGIAHRTAARIVSRGVTSGTPGRLAMDGMPGVGLVSTHSLNSIVTDSSPGMSCYSTGNHARNNQEGVYPGTVTNPFYAPRVEYLGHYLHRTRGTALGIVTTADVEDATPAAMAVFTAARANGTGICDQYLDEADASGTGRFGSGLRVLMGGGRRWFLPSTDPHSSRAVANDYGPLPADLVAGWGLPKEAAGAIDEGRDLLGDFRRAGFQYADSKNGLDEVVRSSPPRLLGLFALGNMNVALDKISARRARAGLAGYSDAVVRDHLAPDQPMLDEMTAAALAVLRRSPKGFLLLVEGAHIDKQSHQMDAERAIGETIELDRAVQVGLDFAKADGRTLVLVTADHECSGFSLIGGLNGAVPKDRPHAGAKGLAAARTLPPDGATLDPATAPSRQSLVATSDAAGFPSYRMLDDGYPESFDVDGKLLVGFGADGDRYESWLTPERPSQESLTPANLTAELGKAGYAPPQPVKRTEKSELGYFIRGQATGQEQAAHTAADVPLSAYAKEQRAWLPFVGTYENVDVFFKIARVLER